MTATTAPMAETANQPAPVTPVAATSMMPAVAADAHGCAADGHDLRLDLANVMSSPSPAGVCRASLGLTFEFSTTSRCPTECVDEIKTLADAGVHGSGELRRVALAITHRTRLRPGLPCRLCAFAFWLLPPSCAVWRSLVARAHRSRFLSRHPRCPRLSRPRTA